MVTPLPIQVTLNHPPRKAPLTMYDLYFTLAQFIVSTWDFVTPDCFPLTLSPFDANGDGVIDCTSDIELGA